MDKKLAFVKPYNGKTYKQARVNGKNVNLHRAVAEKALGKPLPAKAPVHHADGGLNGGPLVICEDHEYHMLLHTRQKSYAATGDPRKKRCSVCKAWDDPENMTTYQLPEQIVYRHFACVPTRKSMIGICTSCGVEFLINPRQHGTAPKTCGSRLCLTKRDTERGRRYKRRLKLGFVRPKK